MTVRSPVRARLLCGALAALVSAAAPVSTYAEDPSHDPTVNCDVSHQQSGNFFFAGVATAPSGHDAPTQLTVVCKYTTSHGGYMSMGSSPGPVAVAFGGGPRFAGITRICASATAVYADGHTGTAPETCHFSEDLVPPPPVTP